MNRDYESGVLDTPVLFVGKEVERTRHYNEQTLFVVGLEFSISDIAKTATEQECTHIYLAANHSYPSGHQESLWLWYCESLGKDFNVTLEVEHKHLTEKLINASDTYDFVLMVGCPVPNIHKNVVVKVDDIDFKATNPGVWTVMPLTHTDVHFTSWECYTSDKVIQ